MSLKDPSRIVFQGCVVLLIVGLGLLLWSLISTLQ